MPLDVHTKNPFSDAFPSDLAKELAKIPAEDIKNKSLNSKVKTLLTNPETRGKFLEWAMAHPVALMNHPLASKVFKRIHKETDQEAKSHSQSETLYDANAAHIIEKIEVITQELRSDPQNDPVFPDLQKWIENPSELRYDSAVRELLKDPKTKDEVLPLLQSYLEAGILSFERLFELALVNVNRDDDTTLLQDEKISKFLTKFLDKLDSKQLIEVFKMENREGRSFFRYSGFLTFFTPFMHKLSKSEQLGLFKFLNIDGYSVLHYSKSTELPQIPKKQEYTILKNEGRDNTELLEPFLNKLDSNQILDLFQLVDEKGEFLLRYRGGMSQKHLLDQLDSKQLLKLFTVRDGHGHSLLHYPQVHEDLKHLLSKLDAADLEYLRLNAALFLRF